MKVYYNDNDPFVCHWLRNLIAAGQLPPGDVDARSITEVQPDDVRGYDQCHFFAGIGGWPHALQLAGWTGPIWTGSCPCQPFSAAGKRKAHDDKRHLWPDFFRLIRELRPKRVVGEQVAGAIGLYWLDGVCTDLEAEAYTVGAIVLGAHSVSAPHKRQRLYWVAESDHANRGSFGVAGENERNRPNAGRQKAHGQPGARREVYGLADSECRTPKRYRHQLAATARENKGRTSKWQRFRVDAGDGGRVGGLVDTESHRLEGFTGHESNRNQSRRVETLPNGSTGGTGTLYHWTGSVWMPCRDGKARRIEPSIEPLVDGVPGRVGRLRAYGNAIVPQVAAEFLMAYMNTEWHPE